MREYRGKRKDNGKWVYGKSYCNLAGLSYIAEYSQGEGSNVDGKIIGGWIQVSPKTVGQFTGKKDDAEHAHELFEDDICKATWCCAITFENEPHELIATIDWDETDLIWRFDYGYGSVALADENLQNIERIGNIHDNPDLLEGESQ